MAIFGLASFVVLLVAALLVMGGWLLLWHYRQSQPESHSAPEDTQACSGCGLENRAGATYCARCGQPLSGE